MKRTTIMSIAILSLLNFYCGDLCALPTSAYQAEKVVAGWLKAYLQPSGTTIGQQIISVETFSDADGGPIYYIVDLLPRGFVIVSADDLVEPIIGFVTGGPYDPSENNPLGALVGRDLPHRIAAARSAQKHVAGHTQTEDQAVPQTTLQKAFLKTRNKWAKLQSYAPKNTRERIIAPLQPDQTSAYEFQETLGDSQDSELGGLGTLSDVRVPPLVESKWSQSTICDSNNPVNCYNYFTPNNYVCGCTATAMAQLMRYHQYPTEGIGVHTFEIKVDDIPQEANTRGGDGTGGPHNWDDMVLVPDCSTTEVQRQAIGALCYDVGVAANMDYAEDGSGAWSFRVRNAIVSIFSYSNAITRLLSSENISPIGMANLIGMINPNLDASLPVILVVGGDERHSVISDGYGYDISTLYHHLNMGWGGYEDVWYNLPEVGTYYNFDIVDGSVYNIFTSGSGEIISGRVTDTFGNPISEAHVVGQSSSESYTAETNSRGIYALAKVPSTSIYTVTVKKRSYDFIDQNVTTGTSVNGESTSGNLWGIDFQGQILPYDDFNDNNQSSIWQLYEEDRSNCWADETNKRFEIRSTSSTNGVIAEYVPNWWTLEATDDFSIKIDFHYSSISVQKGWIGITLENDNSYVSISAGSDSNESYFYYETVVDGNTILERELRDSNDGTLYISYDANSDILYLSHVLYGKQNAYIWQTTSNPTYSQWSGNPVYTCIGGGSNNVELSSGDAYLDNFIVESGTLVKELLVHWRLDDNTSNTKVVDSYINGNHGTAQQNTSELHTTGAIDGALTFDGTSYISCSHNSDLSFAKADPYSICAWIKTKSESTQTIASKDVDTNYGGWSVYIQGNVVRAILANQLISPVNAIVIKSSTDVIDTTDETDDDWRFVTVTYDGSGRASGMKIYVDANSEPTTVLYDSLNGTTQNTDDLEIGRRSVGQYFNGDIDQVRIFSKTLSAAEILELYNEPPPPEPDLLPPTPNPATWASAPSADSDTEISMMATTGTDASGPVEFYFAEISGNPGGTDSNWQTSPSYTDTGLSPSTQYTYTVQMRDNLHNTGIVSDPEDAMTDSAPPPPSDLLAQWAMDDNAANITVLDSSGNNNHGTAQVNTDTISVPGKIDRALSFNGTSDYVSCPYDSDFSFARTDPYSVCAWVYTTSDSTQTIVSKDTGPNYTGWSVYIQGGVVRSILANQLVSPVNGIVVKSSTIVNNDINNGDWCFVSVTYDGSGSAGGMKIYVDAILDTTTALYDTLTGTTENTADLKIGRRWFGQYFDGDMDQMRIFNKILSNAEILELYRPPDLFPPTPNPPTWASAPSADGDSSINMTATTCFDPSGVEYFFQCTSGNGHDSGWQDSPSYTDTNLNPNTEYCYRVKARDKSVNQNETTWSAVACVFTEPIDIIPPEPNQMTWATKPYATGPTSISMIATTASDNKSGVQYYFNNVTVPNHDSGWQDSPSYTDTNLVPNTEYTYRVKAHDKSANQNETDWSAFASATTDFAPPPNLVAHWAMDDNAANTTVFDSSGNSHNGTAQQNTSVLHTSRAINGALMFDGTNDYVSCPHDSDFSFTKTDPYSVCAWVYTASDSTQTIVSKDTGPNYTGWSVYIQGGVVRAILANQLISPVNGIVVKSSTDVIDVTDDIDDDWRFVTVTYDGSGRAGGMKIYIDANSDPTTALYNTLTGTTQNTADLKIGRRWFGQYFDGDIDQVRIFNKTLSAAEVLELYEERKDLLPPTPDPMTWATVPYAISSTSISMTATTASDKSGVQYYFNNVTDPNHDSGWQNNPSYCDIGLDPNAEYTYRVKAQDKSTNQNETGWSAEESAKAAIGTLSVAPVADFNSLGYQGGPFSPSNQVYIVENTGYLPITVEISNYQSWITVSELASSQSHTTDEAVSLNEKLIDSQMMIAEFEGGREEMNVIVTLNEPAALNGKVYTKSEEHVHLHRAEIANRQTAVLSQLTLSEFTLRRRYENISAFSGEITIDGLNKLLEDPSVKSIEPVKILYPHLAQGIPLMNASMHRSTFNGKGIAIAICDTGVDYVHPMLGEGGFPNSKVIGGYDTGSNDPDPFPYIDTEYGSEAHGTACAGIAAGSLGVFEDYIGGVAYNAKIYALKISVDPYTYATTDSMVAAWDWCITHQNDDPSNPIMVISTSFGGGRYFSPAEGDSVSPAMTAAANRAVAAGITVFASSGNDGLCDSMAWPAAISSVISVGAVYDEAVGSFSWCLDEGSCANIYPHEGCYTGYAVDDTAATDKVIVYSNTASFLDIFAPSKQTYTLDITGPDGYTEGNYIEGFGGTSAACPYAAGAIACLQEAAMHITGNYLSPNEIRSILTTSGDNITDNKVAITKPRVNLGNAIKELTEPNFVVTLMPGESINLTVSINSNADNLAPGSYADTVLFTNTSTYENDGDTSRQVSLIVSRYVTSLEIIGDSEVNEQSGSQYTCMAHYSNGTSENVTSEVNWDLLLGSDYAFIDSNGYLTTGLVTSDEECKIMAAYQSRDDVNDTQSVIIKEVPNQKPVISSVTATPPSISIYQTSQLQVYASDPDSKPSGGQLTYKWTVREGEGNLDNNGIPNPIYTPPRDLKEPNTFTLTIEVSDGEDTTTDTVTITVSSFIAYWKMDDNAANTTVLDSSGYDHHGAAQRNTEYMNTTGIIDGALTFNGSDYVSCPHALDYSFARTDPYSVCAWIRTSNVSPQTIVSKDVDENYRGWAVYIQGGVVRANLSNQLITPVNAIVIKSSTDVNDYAWRFVTVTYDGSGSASGMKIYLEANSDPTSVLYDTLTGKTQNTDNLEIGRRSAGQYFLGDIDDVKIFDKALSAAEVLELYNEGISI